MSTHTISTTEYPILQHHIIAGRPVVPFALLAEWLGHCALHDNPGLEMAGFDDLRLTNGIKLDGEGHRIQMMAGKALRKQDGYEVTVEIRNAGTAHDAPSTHARAVAILTESRPVPPSSPRQVPGGLTPLDRSLEEVYRSILFHGEPLQGIRDILGLDDRRMAARLSTAPKPNAWVRHPLRSRWISDPLVLDAAFQMAIVWCAEKHGQMSLPVYIGSYRQYCRRFPDDGVTAIMHITDTSRRKITGDFQFLDKNGHMLAVISNYEAIMDRSLSDAFKQKNAA